ncbi:MAG: AMP-binding protein [Natronospirillum sp.]|uniref:AMP-binding protein n=1 Tax=Natronospirillum sp. TaxID=2812955 RepID=UPI0025FD68B3|nr:AMP-binding protein [Natronospirillum sp.]MCH8551617.1 AMP-binding protein [Natronospirillum sp.]
MSHDQVYDAAPWSAHYAEAHREPEARLVNAASLPELLSQAGEQWADKVAFTTCMPNGMAGRLTYRQVEDKSDAFAVWLRAGLKLEPGTRVAVQMPNCLTLPVVAFGVLKAGCVLVNVNPLYTRREMEHQFNDSGAEVLIIANLFADKAQDVVPNTPVRTVVLTHMAQWFPPVVKSVLHLVMKYWNRVLPKHSMDALDIESVINEGRKLRDSQNIKVEDYWQSLKRDDMAVLQYTGGTTGVSKGAVLTHGNLLSNLEQVDTLTGRHIASGEECILTALPMYHIFAFTVNLLAFYYSGAHNVLVPSPRPIKNCQRAFDNYPISWISGVNTLYNALLNEEWFTVYPPPNMKVALAGGTALHKAVAERWMSVVGKPISEGYGLTETSPVVCFNLIGTERPDSIGVPAPNTQVRLVDDEGQTVPLGEPGELVVKGPQVMTGYWNRPEETDKSIKDGWFYTGDVAVMEADGHFRIVDRKKDMVLVSGFNVYPNEVEDCIARLPQVQESAVIGIPDEQTGEAVKAFVVLREEGLSAQDVIAHCRKELAAYKVPKKVEFRDDLPKTPVGKVLRKELRDPSQTKA